MIRLSADPKKEPKLEKDPNRILQDSVKMYRYVPIKKIKFWEFRVWICYVAPEASKLLTCGRKNLAF